MTGSLVDRLREPAYIGENRCYPCTAINVALVGAAAALIGAVALPAGVAVACGGLAVIGFRGYVVPGTPRLTRRYLPDRLLAAFGKSRPRRGGFAVPNGSVSATDDPTEMLVELGVLAHPDEPSLSASFRASWSTAAGRLAGDDAAVREAAAEALSVAPERVAVDDADGGVTLAVDGEWAGDWPSRTALVADVAAELTLDGDAWADLDRVVRADLTARIRGLAATCPVCGSETTASDDTVESCCRSADVVAVTCTGCGDRLAEFERSPAAFAPGA
ncbi:hypothetical protein [Haloplanus halophilus]|uniref:hypothetical protein n=1 Tax=Haloplanus halophilus TaxID=2949993 RepID=UPI00203F6A0D|nr:hypothetical protein [Haloplanus sp. GDY1]